MAEIQAQAEEKKRADEIQMAKIEVDIELALKEMGMKAQALTSKNAAVDPPSPRNIDAKSPKLSAFIDERGKRKLDRRLLRFECYAENAKWEEKHVGYKLNALLTGRVVDIMDIIFYIPGCPIKMLTTSTS